jgi:hypothetical protein
LPDWVKKTWAGLFLWLSENSVNRHLATLPLGTLLTTWLLIKITGTGAQWWSKPADLIAAGQAVPFGAVLYSSLVLLLEGGAKLLFFALAQRKGEIEKRRQEGEQRERDRWTAWNKRRMDAEANDEDFDEPPPSGTTCLVTSK